MVSLSLVALLAIGGLFFVVAVVTVAFVAVVIFKKSSRGSKASHPEVAACKQCGFVAQLGKIQCPSCGCKVGELVGG